MTTSRVKVPVLIVLNEAMACEVLAQALNGHPGFEVVGHATTSREAAEIAKHTRVDVALIGLALADGPNAGLDAIKQIGERQRGTKSVILLDRPGMNTVIAPFRAGARGIFDTSAPNAFARLCRCVEQVSAGHVWATQDELLLILDALCQPGPLQIVNSQGIDLLTKREEEVVRLVAEGFTNREIAFQLKLSEHTVRNTLFRVFDKLGVSTRVELTLRALNGFERRPGPGRFESQSQEFTNGRELQRA